MRKISVADVAARIEAVLKVRGVDQLTPMEIRS
jgi:hypothetical protein